MHLHANCILPSEAIDATNIQLELFPDKIRPVMARPATGVRQARHYAALIRAECPCPR